MRSQISTRRWSRLLVVLLGLALVAAACGNDDGDTDAQPDSEETTTTEAPDEGEPVNGGRLVYGLEAAAQSPWTPQAVICDISCHMVMRTVYDTLTLAVEGPDGPEIAPHLLESFSANEDLTQWTLVPREGIAFHDGTPFDANAIKVNLDGHLTSFLTGAALLNVESIEVVDGNSVVVTMATPWGSFPDYLAGQIGYMASPTWLQAVADGAAQADQPVGTGPFVFQSFEPGASFVATKNPDYWRADEGLPYLDEIELRVIADVQARRTALLNGDIDMTHTSQGETISQLRGADVETTELTDFPEVNYVLLNVANPDSPINDVRIRRAMAHALDNEVLIERRSAGVLEPANGPWGPGQPGELEDTGYPEFDQDAARDLVEEYKTDNGIDGPVRISYTTTSDPFNLGTAELLKQFWDAVGFETEVSQVEQGSFIVTALRGDFEAFGWRLHSGFNPDTQRIWWHSETAICGARDTCPDGGEPGFALNFGRIRDDVIDEALDTIRGSDDPEVLEEQAEVINRRFGEQAYNLWTSETIWMIAQQPYVNGLGTWTLPDDTNVLNGNGIGGAHGVLGLWCDGGQCGS